MLNYTKAKLKDLDAFIKGLNFAKVSDKDVRNTFIRLIPQVARRMKEMDEDKKALFSRIVESIPEERRKAYDEANHERMEAMERFKKTGSELDRANFESKESAFVNEYKDVLPVVDEFVKAVNDLEAGTTELSVEHIPVEKFLDSMQGQDIEVNAKTFELLEPIVKFED